MKLFHYDGPLMSFLSKWVDYMILGILWILFCIPVFTSGAATTAALLTAEIAVRKGDGKLFRTFWKWFRKEFKEATLLWLIHFPLTVLLIYNVWLVFSAESVAWVKVIILVASGIMFSWSQLWFGYLSKFEDRIKTILSNTFRITLSSLGRVFLLGVIGVLYLVAAVALFFLMPPLLLLVPGSYLPCCNAIIGKIFARYTAQPEQEAVSAEDCQTDNADLVCTGAADGPPSA